MLSFNIPPCCGNEADYIRQAIEGHKICGDGAFTARCTQWLQARTGAAALLTTSCTHALELAAMLAAIEPGDEVIMPSFTFVSTANAFVLRGAKIVFVDIRPDTMNIDETRIEQAITPHTRAIVPVHYAGVACEMDTILDIARRHGLTVIEDAAQGVMSTYHGQALGAIGDFGCYSFHETKNYSMGEGGAILLRHEQDVARAEILREKGTNRSQFWRGEIDKYTWVDIGSSYLPSELNAAYLMAQLDKAEEINASRLRAWNAYAAALSPLRDRGAIELPTIPAGVRHNGHMFWIKCRDINQRQALIAWLREREIMAVFHYVPLHTSLAGRRFGVFSGEDRYTTRDSERLLRLPLWYGLTPEQAAQVAEAVTQFYQTVVGVRL